MDATIYLVMGRAARAGGDTASALADLSKARALAPDNPEIAYELGALKASNNQFEEAVELFGRVIKQAPSAPAYHARAVAYFSLKRKTEALADIEAAVRLMPNEPAMRQWREKIQAMP
jgi:tetratricopeptide (TPR) repeat protein